MTLAAFELSEKYQVPVILRMTTRINHVKALVTVGERPNLSAPVSRKIRSRFVMVPGNAGKRIPLMFQRDITLRAEAEQSAWNVIEPGQRPPCRLHHIRPGLHACQGILPRCAGALKLGFRGRCFDKCRELAALVDQVVVVEEVEPLVKPN